MIEKHLTILYEKQLCNLIIVKIYFKFLFNYFNLFILFFSKKRENYETFLKGVDLLQTVDSYEISQIADALKTMSVNAGEAIIKQNENGDIFYILEEGECYAEKVFTDGSAAERVKEYQRGSYFGELALIKNEPRAASIMAITDCKLLCLDRLSFKRLLGPIENILKRNSDAYIKYINN